MANSTGFIAGAAAVATLAIAATAHAFPVPDFDGRNQSVPKPGYPDFWSVDLSGSLTGNSSGTVYTLTLEGSGQDAGIFNFPHGAYLIGNEEVQITAHFDSTGHLLTSLANTYEIDGSLAAWSDPSFGTKPAGVSWAAQPVEKLFSTDLTGLTFDMKDQALGFKTTNFGGWANQQQFTGDVTSESLWLYSLLSDHKGKHGHHGDHGDDEGKNQSAEGWGWPRANEWRAFLDELEDHKHLKNHTFNGIASIATVPLPGAIWLLASGLAGIGGFFRRRRREG